MKFGLFPFNPWFLPCHYPVRRAVCLQDDVRVARLRISDLLHWFIYLDAGFPAKHLGADGVRISRTVCRWDLTVRRDVDERVVNHFRPLA